MSQQYDRTWANAPWVLLSLESALLLMYLCNIPLAHLIINNNIELHAVLYFR